MIEAHNRLLTTERDFFIKSELKQFGLHGNISFPLLKMFYNIFSYIYIDGYFNNDRIDNEAIKTVLSKYDLTIYKGESISYSAVLFYGDLSKTFNMSSLYEGSLIKVTEKSNKLLDKEYFLFDDLYNLYSESSGDLSDDFLLFNDLFKTSEEKEVSNIKSYGEVIKTISKTALVRPDFQYKLATKQLEVNYIKENDEVGNKVIYVLQDCTESTTRYVNHMNMLKGFILNEAFKHDYKVEWLFVEQHEIDSQQFSKETIKQTEIKNVTFGYKVNVTNLLTQNRFSGKQVIIITDGTDPFDFKFNTKTRKINVISFTDNKQLKNKIANYGRFFKVFKE